MVKALIIWEDVPERLRIFEYNINGDEVLETVKRCHHKHSQTVGNSIDDEAALDWLSKMLEVEAKLLYDSQAEDNSLIRPDRCDLVIVTGFLL